MGRIEKTVFISYRRTNFYTALAVYQYLTTNGYDVFFDYQSIDSGNFEKTIFENIGARAHFVLVLSSSALERCSQPNDWLRREIETAIELKRNIVPLMMEGFDFGSPTTIQALSGKLATLNTYNGLKLYADYFFDAMEKLRTRFLNKALDDLRSHEVSIETKEANETKKAVANEAAPVEADQLTAEELFERAYTQREAKNYEEAIRYLKEAIQLEPDLDAAHNNLGLLLSDLKRNDEAEAAFRKAIEINPTYDTAYYNLGNLLSDFNRNDEAEAAFRKAIELNPALTEAYSNLGLLLSYLKRNDEAEAAFRKAIELNPALTEAYSNLGLLLRDLKRNNEAEAAYRKAIELNPAFDIAYLNLGQLLFDQGNLEGAIIILTEAIQYNLSSARCYRQRGLFYQTAGNDESALNDYRQAIKLQPDYGIVRMSLFGLLMKIGNIEEASQHEALAREFAKNESEYNRACFESLCNNTEEALNLLKIAFEKGQSSKAWAKQDPDLENISNDLRFKELVGE